MRKYWDWKDWEAFLKRYGWMIFVAVTLLCAVFFFWPRAQQIQTANHFSPVEVSKVKRGSISRLYSTNGVLSPVRYVQIFPEIDGRVEGVLFKQGSLVKKGEPLVLLDDRLLKAQLADAKARFDQADAEYQSAKKLHAKKFLADIEFKEKASKRAVAAAAVEVALLKVHQAEIRAPFDGMVGLSNVNEGSTINRQQEVTTLLALDMLYVDFSLPDSLLKDFSTDQPVDVFVEGFGVLPVEARVVAVDTKSTTGTHSVSVRSMLEKPLKGMRPGQFASVSVSLGNEDGALLVPAKSIIQEGRSSFVYSIIDNVAIRREVVLGGRESNLVQIKEGLKEGDYVVTVGQVNLRDGSSVKVLKKRQNAPKADAEKPSAEGTTDAQTT